MCSRPIFGARNRSPVVRRGILELDRREVNRSRSRPRTENEVTRDSFFSVARDATVVKMSDVVFEIGGREAIR